MKPLSVSVGPSGLVLLSRTVKFAGFAFVVMVAAIVAYQIFSNLNEQRQWSEYASENGCYISSQGKASNAGDEHGGRLATNPAAKVWSCDNGLKFTRY